MIFIVHMRAGICRRRWKRKRWRKRRTQRRYLICLNVALFVNFLIAWQANVYRFSSQCNPGYGISKRHQIYSQNGHLTFLQVIERKSGHIGDLIQLWPCICEILDISYALAHVNTEREFNEYHQFLCFFATAFFKRYI